MIRLERAHRRRAESDFDPGEGSRVDALHRVHHDGDAGRVRQVREHSPRLVGRKVLRLIDDDDVDIARRGRGDSDCDVVPVHHPVLRFMRLVRDYDLVEQPLAQRRVDSGRATAAAALGREVLLEVVVREATEDVVDLLCREPQGQPERRQQGAQQSADVVVAEQR